MFAQWPCPLSGGEVAQENARVYDRSRSRRLLLVAPLFDEHNKMRRQMVELMRRLDAAGIDCILPDLPGTNESLQDLSRQSLESWRMSVKAAATHFSVDHVFAVRGGALLAPNDLPGWVYGPVAGNRILRSMLRARTVAAREARRSESVEQLSVLARNQGIELAGWKLGADMFAQLEAAPKPTQTSLMAIDPDLVSGSPLWLRAEPDDDPEQTDALAAIVAMAYDHEDAG